jgi:hypothetical protein
MTPARPSAVSGCASPCIGIPHSHWQGKRSNRYSARICIHSTERPAHKDRLHQVLAHLDPGLTVSTSPSLPSFSTDSTSLATLLFLGSTHRRLDRVGPLRRLSVLSSPPGRTVVVALHLIEFVGDWISAYQTATAASHLHSPLIIASPTEFAL